MVVDKDSMVLILSLCLFTMITTLSTNSYRVYHYNHSSSFDSVVTSLLRLDKITCMLVTCSYRQLPNFGFTSTFALLLSATTLLSDST